MVDESTKLGGLLGGPTAKKFATTRGLHTVGDLLKFWPRRYATREADLSRLHPGDEVVVVGEVRRATTLRNKTGRGSRLEVVLTDGVRDLPLVFFRPHGHEAKLVPGARGAFAGKVTTFNQHFQMSQPGYTLFTELDEEEQRGLFPIYLRVPGLHTWAVSEAVRLVLAQVDEADDPIPEAVLETRHLPGRLEALRGIHTPDTREEVERSRHRMVFEEAFVLQTALAQRRARHEAESTRSRTPREGGLLAQFDERLPFELTAGQTEVGRVLAEEMAREVPMHRLLQGEVGSGKTIIALRAMLAAVDAGGQAALLAPTEVLAAQHHRSITSMLGDLAEGGMLGGNEHATRVVLLTGSMSTAARRAAMLDIASGEAGLVIGTHALLEEKVDFFDLALVVVDEQHRFGVEQRDALRGKGATPPHVLVMTATPIPRTVAMTVFGDMETSTLTELPRGRQPITTHVVPEERPGWVARTWERIAEEVRTGRQAYVVCPRIGEEGDTVETDGPAEADVDVVFEQGPEGADGDEGEAKPPRPLRSVHAVRAEMATNPALEGLRIEILHGRLAPEDKDAVMTRFHRGDIDVLVSTTVIEVGVDVPNASVMLIVDADRFGVSQLHQLRGRVGRGGHPGLCLLMSATEAESARERLAAVAATTNGFDLARLDLELRREGDVLGAAQSGGRSGLDFLSVLKHEDVILEAREDAFAVVAADPDLTSHPHLAAALARRLDAEQAAYLERG
ncbi:ATP-dependent DNA helicase RecG [Janibacter sp. G1551]|uniref:ATP-dependent DNA helicase RecG n=1 Tax=Janibacter sp. G1551 TaxID=3420440 RepID=UPI003D0736DF